MDFEYSSEQKLLWDSVRKLMQRVTTPEYLRRLDRERIYPYELYDAWVDAGLFALSFAEEYGGAGGNVVDLAIVSEEIGRYSADVAMAFGGSMFYALNVARKGSSRPAVSLSTRNSDMPCRKCACGWWHGHAATGPSPRALHAVYSVVGILPLPGNEALILSAKGRNIAVRKSIGLQPHSVTVLL